MYVRRRIVIVKGVRRMSLQERQFTQVQQRQIPSFKASVNTFKKS